MGFRNEMSQYDIIIIIIYIIVIIQADLLIATECYTIDGIISEYITHVCMLTMISVWWQWLQAV